MSSAPHRALLRFRLVPGPLAGSWAEESVAGPDAGCVILFRGTVRGHARGRQVLRLEYEAYEDMVGAELQRIVAEVFAEHEALRAAVEHAVGTVPVGACSVALAVAAAHRAPAFAAAQAIMDALKARVPIWKKEVYADGSAWIGQGS